MPENIRTVVRNNGGGHANHSLFWTIMGPGAGGEPTGDLAEAINSTLRRLRQVQGSSSPRPATTRFGSGWAWLSVDRRQAGRRKHAQSRQPADGKASTPILGLDVWEHAYYLNYQNRRPDYIAAFWNVVNWDEVANRSAKAKG